MVYADDDAGLVEWMDARRIRSERARDRVMAVAVVIPVAIMVVVIRLAFGNPQMPGLWTGAFVAGGIFAVGLLVAIGLGIRSAWRTRAFVHAMEAALPVLGEQSVIPLRHGERVGNLLVTRLGTVASDANAELTIAHQGSIGSLQVRRVLTLLLGAVTGVGAGVLGVMLIGQGSLGVKGTVGVISMGCLVVSIGVWLVSFHRAQAVRLDFDKAAGRMRVVCLVGIGGKRILEIPFSELEGMSYDYQELMDSRRVVLAFRDEQIEIARFPASKGNIGRGHARLAGFGQRADHAHEALCAYRAGRLVKTIEEFLE